jgi:hypothetical protein
MRLALISLVMLIPTFCPADEPAVKVDTEASNVAIPEELIFKDQPLVTYQFSEMKPHRFDKFHKTTDPEARYEFSLVFGAKGSRIPWATNYKEVQSLMKYFHVESPAALNGKSFSSTLPFRFALNLMKVQADHDFK